ncbi:hypothetical protein LIER_08586 [Lithospermum erythrorhizon]|uniref:RNase H type-1 domain-containing protein n=1 Tax=Lithospermum erythrorhizon TaxID=34254 RepID=A0AAV3PGJ3_LITER
MFPEDEEKTTFFTEYGMFYRKVMPFRLKNARATYQRMTNVELHLYLAISEGAISSVLIRETDGTQKPVYYISHILHGAEENYPLIDKFAFTVVISTRKLKIYFESHPIKVITNQPLNKVLASRALSGERLTTCAIELSEFEISFEPRASIKAQALADFIVECRTAPPQWIGEPDEGQPEPLPDWVLYVDGAKNNKESVVGLLICWPKGVEMEYALRFNFEASNNETEYEALVAGLELAHSLGVKQILVRGDSKLIMDQIKGDCRIKNESLIKYHAKATTLAKDLTRIVFEHIPRIENE